jgi:hypothetical protein
MSDDKALFAFFFNAVSSVECSLYGLFHIGAMADPSAFPIASDQALRRIDRAAVKKCFQATFSTFRDHRWTMGKRRKKWSAASRRDTPIRLVTFKARRGDAPGYSKPVVLRRLSR